MKDHWGYEKESKPDFVAVVRCKDCKHWTEVYQDKDGYKHGYCVILAVDNGSFFCAYGERRNE